MSWIIKFSPGTWQKREIHHSSQELTKLSISCLPLQIRSISALPSLTVSSSSLTQGLCTFYSFCLEGTLFPSLPYHSHPPEICSFVWSSEEEPGLTSSSFISSFPYFFPSWYCLSLVPILFIVCFFLCSFLSREQEFQDGNEISVYWSSYSKT